MSDEDIPPMAECDVIMKGGITSGVVYPEAIVQLSQHYRFRSIGGTSAGAIAAAITAAAEYNRAGGGFKTIAALPGQLQQNLSSLFQPSPEANLLYTIGVEGFVAKRWSIVVRCILSQRGPLLLAGLAVGVLLAVAAYVFAGEIIAGVLLILIGALFGLVLLARSLGLDIFHTLPKLDFGMCPGPTQAGHSSPGLSDWIAETIEIAAGRMTPGGPTPEKPLTFGDLWAGRDKSGSEDQPAIDLRLMTTNLSLRRPNALPRLDGNHSFREDELRRVMPGWIVDYLVEIARDAGQGYYMLPTGGDLPVAVAVRMSLSFPFLLAAVPLYRAEFPFEKQNGDHPIQRMLFSDGGLSSNFPIHFFDAVLPRRPTFGISLEEVDPRLPDRRVNLPMSARSGMWLEARQISSVPSFAFALVNAAKDWQDRLQMTLPGYRERVVTVYLTSKEGGLNLTMPPEVIGTLSQLGGRAGNLLAGLSQGPTDREPFRFDDHRWRRFLVAFARFEATLEQAATIWGSPQDPASYSAFVQSYIERPESYAGTSLSWRQGAYDRFNVLMSLAASWRGNEFRHQDGGIPKPDTDMRITPKP